MHSKLLRAELRQQPSADERGVGAHRHCAAHAVEVGRDGVQQALARPPGSLAWSLWVTS